MKLNVSIGTLEQMLNLTKIGNNEMRVFKTNSRNILHSFDTKYTHATLFGQLNESIDVFEITNKVGTPQIRLRLSRTKKRTGKIK